MGRSMRPITWMAGTIPGFRDSGDTCFNFQLLRPDYGRRGPQFAENGPNLGMKQVSPETAGNCVFMNFLDSGPLFALCSQ